MAAQPHWGTHFVRAQHKVRILSRLSWIHPHIKAPLLTCNLAAVMTFLLPVLTNTVSTWVLHISWIQIAIKCFSFCVFRRLCHLRPCGGDTFFPKGLHCFDIPVRMWMSAVLKVYCTKLNVFYWGLGDKTTSYYWCLYKHGSISVFKAFRSFQILIAFSFLKSRVRWFLNPVSWF